MFSFIKSYTQIFMTPCLFLEISENKNTEYLILILIMQCKCQKIYQGYIEFNSTQHNTESAERQKTSFTKESVEHAGLYKSVLKKIITTNE